MEKNIISIIIVTSVDGIKNKGIEINSGDYIETKTHINSMAFESYAVARTYLKRVISEQIKIQDINLPLMLRELGVEISGLTGHILVEQQVEMLVNYATINQTVSVYNSINNGKQIIIKSITVKR